MKKETIVIFTNFTAEPFVGKWDGVSTEFQPGESRHMEFWRAAHYAKHLVNRVLTGAGHPESCSPKKPENSPLFMEQFNKAVNEVTKIEVPASEVGAEIAKIESKKVEKVEEEEFEGLEEAPNEPIAPKAPKKKIKKKE